MHYEYYFDLLCSRYAIYILTKLFYNGSPLTNLTGILKVIETDYFMDQRTMFFG